MLHLPAWPSTGSSRAPLSTDAEPWVQALARTRIPLTTDADLAADTLRLVDNTGGTTDLRVAVLGNRPVSGGEGLVAVLGAAGPYGRVIEVVGTGTGVDACAALAARMGALPWRTPGPQSVLQRLAGLPLTEQAELAAAVAVTPGMGDPVFLDVATCLAGISPAWSGGPLMWKATSTP